MQSAEDLIGFLKSPQLEFFQCYKEIKENDKLIYDRLLFYSAHFCYNNIPNKTLADFRFLNTATTPLGFIKRQSNG